MLPPVDGVVQLEGRIAPPPAKLYEFASQAGGKIRQNLDLAGFARETGLPLADYSVSINGGTALCGGYVRTGSLISEPRPTRKVHPTPEEWR